MNHATGFTALLLLAAILLGMTSANAAQTAAEVEENVLLTAKVKAALVADKATRAHQIHIETYRGIIKLSGYVATNDERLQAERLAASVPGVREVRNALEIRRRLADGSMGNRNAEIVAAGRVDSVPQVSSELQIVPAH